MPDGFLRCILTTDDESEVTLRLQVSTLVENHQLFQGIVHPDQIRWR